MSWHDPPVALTKLKVCEEIAEMIKNKGCKKPLDPDCVYNKITHVESKMRHCRDQFAGTKTGNGLKESDPMAYEDKVSECLYHTTFEQPCHVTLLYLSFQVKRICPYYFDLEAVFTQCAGLVPAAQTDELFGPYEGDDNIDTVETTMEESGSSSLTARRRASTPSQVKPASKKRSARCNKMYYPEDEQFNRFLSVVTKRSTQSSNESKLAKVSKVVRLMGESEQATKHMKCPVKVVYVVPSFVQFLIPAQKRELKQYKKEIAEAEAEFSEDEEN